MTPLSGCGRIRWAVQLVLLGSLLTAFAALTPMLRGTHPAHAAGTCDVDSSRLTLDAEEQEKCNLAWYSLPRQANPVR